MEGYSRNPRPQASRGAGGPSDISRMAIVPGVSLILAAVLGDLVVLKNGNEIRGEVLQESEDALVVRFPGGTLELRRRDVERVDREPRRRYLVGEGERALARGAFADAVAAFEEAVRADPDSERAREGLLGARLGRARELREIGRYAEARALCEEVLRGDPGSPAARHEVEAIEKTLEDGRREEERALEEIRRGDLEAGIWRLGRVYDRFPDRRGALRRPLASAIAEEGRRLLERSEWEAAEERYLRALALEPEILPRVAEPYAFAVERQVLPLVEEGKFEAAERKVREGLDVHPGSRALRYYLGLAFEARGDARRAAEEYLAILDAKRPAKLESAAAALRLEVEEKLASEGRIAPVPSPVSNEVLSGDFRELKTLRFTIRHKNPAVAKEVALVAERSYARIFERLGCAAHPRSSLQIVVFPTREEFLAASALGDWAGGSHAVARRLGSLSEHRIHTYQDEPRLASGVLPHEVAHALFAHRLAYPERIPLWANEGYAVLEEPEYFHRHCRETLARELARRAALPIRDLVQAEEYPRERPEVFYAQSFSLVEFLVELEGLGAFVEFVKDLSRRGTDFDDALKRRYKIAGIAALENRWLGWFERSVARGSNPSRGGSAGRAPAPRSE